MVTHLYNLLHLAGSLFCHQDITKTLKINNLFLPLCARCSGIYLGISISFIYLFKIKKFSINIDKKSIYLFSFFIFLLFLNIAGSLFKFWNTPNIPRFFISLFGGTGIGFFLGQIFSFLNYEKFKETGNRNIFFILFFPFLTFLLFLYPVVDTKIYYFFLSTFLIFSVFLTYFFVNWIIISILLKKETKNYWIKSFFLFLLLFISEFVLLYFVHNF